MSADLEVLRKQIEQLQEELLKKESLTEDGKPNPFSQRFFNLSQQGEIFRKSPILAEEMAARAGTVPGVRPK